MDEYQDFLQDSESERLDFSHSVFTPPLSQGTASAADFSISAVSQDPALPMNASLPVPMQCFPSPASSVFGPGQQMYMASQARVTAATGAQSSAGAFQHFSRTPSLASNQCEASHQSPAELWADNSSPFFWAEVPTLSNPQPSLLFQAAPSGHVAHAADGGYPTKTVLLPLICCLHHSSNLHMYAYSVCENMLLLYGCSVL